jgi:hypothetical protein
MKGFNQMTDCSLTAQFSDFLARSWRGDLHHRYAISLHHSWNPWREQEGKEVTEWWCESLAQASKHYSWTKNKARGAFADIATKLRQALDQKDNMQAKNACLDLFAWGGVARKQSDASRLWLLSRFEDGSLVQRIKEAVALLHPDSKESLHRFDGKDLLMNSAMTKVYAAADAEGNVVIYDGRVGAALGLLTRRLLEGLNMTHVPEELAFRWGPPTTAAAAKKRTRDPSKGKFHFDVLPNSSTNRNADRIRADLARSAGHILNKVAVQVKKQGEEISIADLERALFMLGYDVKSCLVNSAKKMS